MYVAMTRARNNLTIHLNGEFLDHIHVVDMVKLMNGEMHFPPGNLTMRLTHKDVNLSYFGFVQHRLTSVVSGDQLLLTEQGCTDVKGSMLAKFSKKSLDDLERSRQQGYFPTQARINWIVFWKNDDMERDIRVLLPEIEFERRVSQ